MMPIVLPQIRRLILEALGGVPESWLTRSRATTEDLRERLHQAEEVIGTMLSAETDSYDAGAADGAREEREQVAVWLAAEGYPWAARQIMERAHHAEAAAWIARMEVTDE